MERTFIVSNRVSVPRRKKEPSAGGLEVALRATLQRRAGIWFGWSGSVSKAEEIRVRRIEHDGLSCTVTDLTHEDYEEYYQGYANSVLWPVLHYRIDLAEFRRRNYSGYMRVNTRLAKELHALLEPGDTVWVHDYHLIPFAQILRDMGHDNRMGFFLHVPLPPADILTVLPNYQSLFGSLRAYDLVGFQTEHDCANFARFYAREFGGAAHVGSDGRLGRERMRVAAFPVGIDALDFRRKAEQSAHSDYVRDVVQSAVGPLIIGVDRADYSKGIIHRFEAFENFLRAHPERRAEVTYLQITPKSRSQIRGYAQLERSLESAAGRINSEFGDARWTPIRYVNRSHTRTELAGLYRCSRVGLVTPLRDGMNLVAKEYVAAQDPADPGVLILSRFAGAAAELSAAVVVNPYDCEAMAAAIAQALAMPLEARRKRHETLFAALLKNDIATWGERFLDALAKPIQPLPRSVRREETPEQFWQGLAAPRHAI